MYETLVSKLPGCVMDYTDSFAERKNILIVMYSAGKRRLDKETELVLDLVTNISQISELDEMFNRCPEETDSSRINAVNRLVKSLSV